MLFGRGRGKIRAVAKGVRRTRSKFGSRLEPGSMVSLQLYEGRNLDIVTQAERVEPLPGCGPTSIATGGPPSCWRPSIRWPMRASPTRPCTSS